MKLHLAIIAPILAPGMAFVNSGAFVGRESSALSMKAQNRDQPSTTMSVFDKVLRPLAPFALSAALLTTQVGVQLPFIGNTVASAAATNKATPANLPKAAEDPVAMMQSQRSVKGKGSAKIDLKYEPIRADTQKVSKAVATAKPKPAKPLSVNDLKDKPEPAKKAAPSRPVPVSRPSPAPKATAKKTAPAPVAVEKKLTTAQKKQAEKSAAPAAPAAKSVPTKKTSPAPATAAKPSAKKLTTAQKKQAEKSAAPAAPAAKSVPTKKTSPAPATPAKPSAKMTTAQKKQAEKKTTATPAKATAPAAKRLTTAQQKALARGS
ncbi:hypothetical protein TrCOL_g3738 [Triparma columacea]|uniref:Uncharacterized protein n=1 Tax=Triparma columacea TaxID=722753 RepID=A0A9W7GRQ6_9STRA|nr:hypothetical protein TrCOL_g3738 [Triparma columacea]